MLTYVHYYSENGTYIDHGRILDTEPYVGYIVKKYKTEGYEPWEIVKIENNRVVFEKFASIKATVKIHPYIKTHCDHEWESFETELLSVLPAFLRKCNKCNKEQWYNFGLSNWTER